MNTSYLDLKGCHAMLEKRLGTSAPSYVTMRRWAADGAFKAFEDANTKGRRARYSSADMLKLVRSRLATKTSATQPKRQPRPDNATPPASPEAASTTPLDLGNIEDLLQELVNRQSRLESLMADTLAAAKGLEAVRMHLMNKYDAQNSANIEVIAQLKARLRTAEDVQSDMKVTIALNRMADRIADLERALGRGG